MIDKKNLVSSESSISSNERYETDSVSSSNEVPAKRHKWKAIRITYAIMFFTSVSYSIQMTSIWPYMNIIDKSYTKEFLGWVVGSYSIGQLLACPIFSYVSGRTGHFRVILLVAALLAIAGNYLYAIIVDLNQSLVQTIVLVGSRSIIGVAGANVASVRLFLSLSTTEEERIGPMAILSACQGLGFIIGPGLQAAFVPIGYPGVLQIPFLRINMYTASAFFGVLTNVIIFVLIAFWFKDEFLRKSTYESLESSSFSIMQYRHINVTKPNFINDYFSAVFMLVAFFFCMMSLSVLETAGTPMTMDNFGWSRAKSTLINSIILSVSGVCSLFILLSLRVLTKKIKEKVLLIIGFVLILGSAIFLIPMGNSPIPIQYENIINPNGTTLSYNNETGCDAVMQPWCLYVPALEIWQYGACLAFFTFGYPAVNLLSYVIFSRLINPTAQSLWMGLLTASGSLARVIGPIFISKLYDQWGTQVAFISWSGIILLFLISTPAFLWKVSKTEKLKKGITNIN